MVATLWLMVNTHQMYIIGVVLVAGFVVHVVVTRAAAETGWLDATDQGLPVAPLVAAWGLGLLALMLSPLGAGALVAPLALFATVAALGAGGPEVAESSELEPIWTDPIGGPVTLLLLVAVGIAGYRARGRWSVLELGVLAMGLVLVAAALRGVPFFSVAAAAVITRWSAKSPPLFREGSPLPLAFAACTGVLAGALLITQLRPQPHAYLYRQQGLGRSVGEWADTTIAFLRDDPPPGEMLNIGWVAANYLNYGVYPVKRVFVDGRWEAYPKPFLDQAMRAQREQPVLDALIAEWKPSFVVAEMREVTQQSRIATLVERGWALVFVDTITAVAVRPGPIRRPTSPTIDCNLRRSTRQTGCPIIPFCTPSSRSGSPASCGSWAKKREPRSCGHRQSAMQSTPRWPEIWPPSAKVGPCFFGSQWGPSPPPRSTTSPTHPTTLLPPRAWLPMGRPFCTRRSTTGSRWCTYGNSPTTRGSRHSASLMPST